MNERRAERGLRDEAGVGPDPREAVELRPLKALRDYKVAEGEPDIRGWRVFTATGREIGAVEDLLVDTSAGEVVMLDIDLQRDDRHSLAPVKAAWIDRAHQRVILNSQYLVSEEDIPALARHESAGGSDAVRRFNEQYDRVYGDVGWDRDREIRIHGPRDDLHLTRPTPPAEGATGGAEPGPAVVRERVVSERTRRGEPADREVHLPAQRDPATGEPLIVEEVVTRRRIVDPSELTAEERAALRERLGRAAPSRPEGESR